MVLIQHEIGMAHEVFIGVSNDVKQDDKLILDPDDSGLGIGLACRIRQMFEDQKICHIWLFGRWGHLTGAFPHLAFSHPAFSHTKDTYPFTVWDVQKRAEEEMNEHEAHIWIKPV